MSFCLAYRSEEEASGEGKQVGRRKRYDNSEELKVINENCNFGLLNEINEENNMSLLRC